MVLVLEGKFMGQCEFCCLVSLGYFGDVIFYLGSYMFRRFLINLVYYVKYFI